MLKRNLWLMAAAVAVLWIAMAGQRRVEARPGAGSGKGKTTARAAAISPAAASAAPAMASGSAAPAVDEAPSAPHDGGHGDGARAFHATPPATPTKVKVGVYLVGITRISPPQEAFPTFKAELFVDVKWKDPRLAFDAKKVGTDREVFQDHDAELRLERMWHPDLQIENEQGKRTVEARELAVRQDGTVEYMERSAGVYHAEVDLRNFPFDHQTFEIDIESFEWDDRYVMLEPLEEKIGFNEKHHTLEWAIDRVSHETKLEKEVRSPVKFSELIFRIHASRDPGYYLWKIVAPLLLIIALTWTAFWMKGESSDARMERNYIALLTVVAFHQVISSNLPKISYVTFLDGVVYVSFGIVGATMLHMIVTQRLDADGRDDLVARMDLHARWVFPLVMVIAMTILWVFYHMNHGAGGGHA